jgi:hypothetical protein
VVVVIAGDAVASAHLQARNGSVEEITRALACVRGQRLLLGPLASLVLADPSSCAGLFDAVHTHTITSADLIHSARTPDGTDIAGRYRGILARAGPLVLDRSFISELVYGPLLHGQSRLSLAEAADLAAIVTGPGGTLVHLTGQPEEIADRLLARDGCAPACSGSGRLLPPTSGSSPGLP